MQIPNLNYQQFNINQIQFKQKITTKQMLNLIDNCRSFDQISLETGLTREAVNEFCLKNFGKTYRNLKSERYNELINIANSSPAKKLWIYKLFPHKLQRSKKLNELPTYKEKDAIRLWENGTSIEDIAKALRAQQEEVFEFLAKIANEKGPIVG